MDRPAKRAKHEEVKEEVHESVEVQEGQRTSDQLSHAGQNTTDRDGEEYLATAAQEIYLDTVDRSKLDFDQEKLCCITLSNLNVYSCLVCGKYFAGRSKSTPAFYHSLEADHHVFMNLATLRVYILPELYENKNQALEDVKYACQPSYTKVDVLDLDRKATLTYDLERNSYRPGFAGLNNRKGMLHIGAVLHAIAHVPPVRNFFLLEDHSQRSEVIQGFGNLVRKMWSSKLFRAHVSPFEFLRQVASVSSARKELFTGADEPLEFMSFLLNTLHLGLGGTKARQKQTSIISACFQGQIKIETQKVYTVSAPQSNGRVRFEEDMQVDQRASPFLFLTLDLPPTPLFQDEVQGTIIPQVPLVQLLEKYNGRSVEELAGHRKRYSLEKLPPFLIFYIKRFKKNDFTKERNPTIVNFPLRSLDMRPCECFCH